MKCDQIKRKLSALLDHELSENEESPIKEHINQCSTCKANLQELGTLRDIIQRIPDIEVPYYFRTRLMQNIEIPGKRHLSFIERLRHAAMPVAAAAAVILSLIAGNYIGENLYQILVNGSKYRYDKVEVLDFALNNFPEGSLSDMYQNVLNGDKNE
jgi:predicted anti-sigma-YlaC factor YlaD